MRESLTVSSYKELYANVVPTENKPRSQKCPSFFLVGQCENGHRYAKKLICGKEWCAICGEKESDAHHRRIARLLPKTQQIESMGYFVIEWPVRYRQVRGFAYSKRAWRLASTKIVKVFRGKFSHGERVGQHYRRGILRWHWFGDPKNGKATWNPHANVLVDGGYLSANELETIKEELRAALKCRDLIVNYSYCSTPRQMYHKVKYITRATFLDKGWDEKMAEELYNFRNVRVWGRWGGSPVWQVNEQAKVEELVALEKGLCPDCGSPLHWSKPWPICYLELAGVEEELVGGYCRLQPLVDTS